MTINEAEVSFNKTWLFLQFRQYEWTYTDLQILIDGGLLNGNKNDLPIECPDFSDIYVTHDKVSNRTNGCVQLKIKLTEKDYKELCESQYYSKFEIK